MGHSHETTMSKLSADEYLREAAEAEDKFRRDHEESLRASPAEGQEEGDEKMTRSCSLETIKVKT